MWMELCQNIDSIYAISPTDNSAIVSLKIFAAYQFERMLGRGELMHEVKLTVGELLRNSNRSLRKLAADLRCKHSI
jgi:hypothetical protein